MFQVENKEIDLAFIQESWLTKNDGFYVNNMKDYSFNVINSRNQRSSDRGGGVAVIYKFFSYD